VGLSISNISENIIKAGEFAPDPPKENGNPKEDG